MLTTQKDTTWPSQIPPNLLWLSDESINTTIHIQWISSILWSYGELEWLSWPNLVKTSIIGLCLINLFNLLVQAQWPNKPKWSRSTCKSKLILYSSLIHIQAQSPNSLLPCWVFGGGWKEQWRKECEERKDSGWRQHPSLSPHGPKLQASSWHMS